MQYQEIVRQDARLIILKALEKQIDDRLNSASLQRELLALGIDKERAWVHTELRWLADMGAVVLTEAETVLVATLTERGARHLRRAEAIEGIARPSRPGG